MLALTGAAGAHSAAGARDASSPSTFQAAEARRALREPQAAMRHLRVIYRAGGQARAGDMPGMYVHREIAVSPPMLLFHHGAYGYDGLDWRDDFLQQRLWALGDRFYIEYPLRRIYVEGRRASTKTFRECVEGEAFFVVTGLWPPEARPAPRPFGRAHVLCEVAQSTDHAHVRPYQEMRGGRSCHVLEMPGADSLWLDMERGACLMARDIFDVTTGRPIMHIELDRHIEVARGLWLPRRIRSIQYDFGAPTEEQSRRKVTDAVMDVESIGVNDIERSVFDFRPAAGSLSRNADVPDSELAQAEPGGLDYLDELVDWIERHHAPPKPPFDRRYANYGYVAVVPFLLCIAILEVHRRKEASNENR